MPGVAPGQVITFSAAGSYNAITHNVSTLREAVINQLLMFGYTVTRLSIEADWSYPIRDYTATLSLKPLGATTQNGISSNVLTAFENVAGSSPAIAVTSAGEAPQPVNTPGILGTAIGAVGTALSNVADAPKDLTRSVNLIVIGIVVLVGFVAFGPNVKDIARAAR